MKLEPVTKFDKRNKNQSQKINYDVMSANFDVTVIFLVYS